MQYMYVLLEVKLRNNLTVKHDSTADSCLCLLLVCVCVCLCVCVCARAQMKCKHYQVPYYCLIFHMES